MQRSRLIETALLLATASSLAACTAPGGPDRIKASFGAAMDAAAPPQDAQINVMQGDLKCRPTNSTLVYQARSTITTGEAHVSTQPTYFTADLFTQFKAVCGGCHVESNLGDFVVGASTFTTKVDQHVLDVMESKDPNVFMPPSAAGGVPLEQRPDTDPVVQLDKMLHQWIDQGRPANSFALPVVDASGAGDTSGYLLSPELGNAMSNIGTCVPDRGMVGTSGSAMDALDTFFATATDLPPTLDKTDLYTLDSEALAREGVISYQPTYPLWTDNAGKMRYVRVPRGKSIVFDKQTQQFTIPANTRFYKTFLKKVTDANGNVGYRKIETRVIVSRPDVDMPDGTVKQTAIFGTYVWNEDESQATLLNDPLRSGKPFADRIFTYITDEQAAQPIIDSAPSNLLLELQRAGVTRHYALPGAERCVQCHMGSPNKSFILAFTPLQVNRRQVGTSGVYEPDPASGEKLPEEELSQLQRLIDYGVISGMASPADVLPLEKAEGTRQPRTDQELNAQAYMVGNCSHCHNPRGLPSTKEPALKPLLNFLPGAGANEGIFEFSLDAVSPVRKRGLYQDTDIPYITPSLYDIPKPGAKFFCPAEEDGSCVYNATSDPDMPPPPIPALKWVLAPWRSLIYRNVDTPYDYFDDFALFPHMPLNSPGYDCRAARFMGDWMVSIPAVLKDASKAEDARPTILDLAVWGDAADLDPQPYREVKPGDAQFADATAAAADRLARYHSSYRYNFCPDTYTNDIVDSTIQGEVDKNLPVVTHTGPFTDLKDPHKVLMPAITPYSPHFVSLDDTDPPGDWFPRRPDWQSALVKPDIPTFVANAVKTQYLTPDEANDLKNVITALTTVTITPEVRAALLTEVPFGLWDTSKPGCNFSSVPTAGSFTGAARPQWMDLAQAPATAPVYVESPGAAVFTTICYNCHGQNADSKGLLAEEISTLTGGDARVANFRDGLFGPAAMPGQNRGKVFSAAAAALGGGVTTDDIGARYLAWMALGGTAKHLPVDVLTQVSQTPVLGTLRSQISPEGTPDMLRLGLQLCSQIAASDSRTNAIRLSDLFATGRIVWSKYTGLVDKNYDAEMWVKVCSLGNRPLVRVPLVANGPWTTTKGLDDVFVSGHQLYWGTNDKGEDAYGANPAMDAAGNITTGLAGNTFPICIAKPTNATEADAATQWLAAHKVRGNAIPFCPPGFLTDDRKLAVDVQADGADFVDARKWAARGAVNAALGVFLYLDQIERDPTKRKPLYNQCSLIGKQ
jgi:mono/diheme cytochrome c family protein